MGVLRAKVGGVWQDIGAVGTDEVQVGGITPVDAAVELWYDTSVNPTTFPGPWTAFVPTLTQGVTVTKTVTSATYTQIGKLVIAQVNLAVTSAGTAANPIRIGLPVAARANNLAMGNGQFYDASTAIRYVCDVGTWTTTEVWLATDGASTDLLGVSPNIALASGDGLRFNISYEAA